MKKSFLTALLLAPVISFAQTGTYTLKGKVGKLNAPAKAYLFYQTAETSVSDSVTVKNGAFQFTGTVAAPTQATLVLDHKGEGLKSLNWGSDLLQVYLEPGVATITSPDSLRKAALKGGPYNEANGKLQQSLAPVKQQMQKVEASYYQEPPAGQTKESHQEKLLAQYDILEQQQKQVIADFIKRNPGTMLSFDVLQMYGGAMPEYSEVAPLFSLLSDEVKNSASAKAYAAQLEILKKTALGAVAPDFSQKTPDGKILKLSDMRGKYVLVDFWASWCGPCRQENPNLVQVYNQYKDKNFTILGVSLDEEKARAAWLKAIEKDQLTWPQVSDLKGFEGEAALLYGIMAIPQNFLIDPAGKIVAKNLRGKELGEKITEILK